MRQFDGNSLTKRLQDAKRSNQERLQKATQAVDDPAAVERKAAERAAAQARRIETAARKEANAEVARRHASEEAADNARQAEIAERNALKEAQAAAEQAELAKADARIAGEQKIALAAHEKAIRDARYATRKLRQRK